MDDVKYGFPVVDSQNIFDVLADRGVHAWDHLQEPMPLADYAAFDLTDGQRSELRFAPRVEATVYAQPNNGEPYTAFRVTLKPWATTFALLPDDLLPIIGEWKHGEETISLAPPSGVMNKADVDILAAGQREFEEETGMKLTGAVHLASEGIPINCRHINQRFYPVLGTVAEPIEPGPSSLDKTEFLEAVLIPASEWIKLIDAGKVTEACSIVTTYMALRRLGRSDLL